MAIMDIKVGDFIKAKPINSPDTAFKYGKVAEVRGDWTWLIIFVDGSQEVRFEHELTVISEEEYESAEVMQS
jgi:hypothetical protein